VGGVSTWPMAARAQRAAMPLVGFISNASAAGLESLTRAFLDGLHEGGYVVGRDVAVEYRWADGQADRVPALVADLISRRPAVIVTNVNAALVVKAATTTIPVVFYSSMDPVKAGLITSFNRPEANLTGVSFFTGALGPKRLELLQTLVPNANVIGVLLDKNQSDVEDQARDAEVAARALGRKIQIVRVHGESEFDAAFETFIAAGSGALLVGNSPFLTGQRWRLVALAQRHALPASFTAREYVEAGGLMSYGPSVKDAFRQVGLYAARVLKGEKPGDLPVQQPAKFETIINLKTAKNLNLPIPDKLLALADEVIE
jgi:putative ABC transport system substrate-binding protein